MHRSPILIARSLPDALAGIGLDTGAVVVIPSSLEAEDRFAVQIADALGLRRGVEAGVMAPPALGGRVRSLVGRMEASGWRSVDVRAIEPSCELGHVAVPERLVDAQAVLVACDLDWVAERGPYVLDVVASYASTSTRLRLHTSRGRIAATAEIDLAVRMRGAILALTVDGERWFVATPDPIAGELVALALTERARGVDRSFIGPWEDPVVQRATELQLGARLPAELDLDVVGGATSSPVGDAISKHLALRLGVS
ncbi:MAG: hypothetical protein QM753_14175 [Thermomicrobiales bacterium]